MCEDFRILSLTLATFLSLPCVAFADSFWDHNGSVTRLVDNGDQRQFIYEQPKQILKDAGVERGTVLFEGHRVGNKYTGTAKRFSKNCPAPLPYDVSGNVLIETKIVLEGRREVYDDNCRPTGRFTRDTLVFRYLQSDRQTDTVGHGSTDVLPSAFMGKWISYYEDTLNVACDETHDEVVTITPKSVEWNVESACGRIDSVKVRPDGLDRNLTVNMTCWEGEGRTRPLEYKEVEIWAIFQLSGKVFMSQTSLKNKNTTLLLKCD